MGAGAGVGGEELTGRPVRIGGEELTGRPVRIRGEKMTGGWLAMVCKIDMGDPERVKDGGG
jgi:hypothetical protein